MNKYFPGRRVFLQLNFLTDARSIARHQRTNAIAAASQLMKKSQDDGQRLKRGKIKIYKNRRKNLTKAERIQPEFADWPSLFSVAQSFNPALVPLPIRMGRVRPNKLMDIPPAAQGNIELLKIPNFFHLTPPAIQVHCKALKEFCTPWPSKLKDKKIRFVTNNYLYAGPSIRHPDSKKVILKVYLKDLELDEHSKTKMILLAGPDRYCWNTDELSIAVDRCPTRKQNKEYALYLLTALYQQSWKREEWEQEKCDDMDIKELQLAIANVLKLKEEMKPVEKKARSQKRTVAGKVVRFNQHGKAFIVENFKYGIFGPPSKEERVLLQEEWDKIKP